MTGHRSAALIVTFLAMLCCGACTVSHREVVEPAADAPATTSDPVLAGIPPLGELAVPGKELSILGPGWTSLPVQEYLSDQNTSPGPGDELTLNGAADVSFAVYGLAGFDGDNGPTSARISASSLTGPYYVAFSDYVARIWRAAGPFTASAEIEIPLPDDAGSSEYLNPSAFCSRKGFSYVAVIVPRGGHMTLTTVEMGVQGGSAGPMWTQITNIGGGDNGCLLRWNHSASYKDPDFAGYLLERAPLLSGDFTSLTPVPVLTDYLIDTTGEIDVTYRYRIAAVDASGNRSIWSPRNGGRFTGDEMNPVPVLKLPRGPVAVTQVTLDMSDSFDPEGDTITNYHFDFINYPAPFDTPAPAPTIDLPPGCHTILATITTSDGRTGSTLGILKNYPIWEDTPHLLATPAVAFTHRLRDMRGVLDPATSRPLFVGWDLCAMGFVSWWQNSAGDFSPHSVPFYRSGPPPYIGEPLAYDNQVYLPVGGPEFFWIARLEPRDGELMNLGIPFPGDPFIALAHDHETDIIAFTAYDTGAQIDLVSYDLSHGNTRTTIVPNIGGLTAIDAEYNLTTGTIDIAFSTPVSTEWVRWVQESGIVADSAGLAALQSSAINLEQSEATGRPGVTIFAPAMLRWTYSELDATSNWIPFEIIDNMGANTQHGGFAYGNNGNAFSYFALGPGPSRLYERTAPATWIQRNSPAYAANGCYEAELLNVPGTDEFYAADGIDNDDIVIGRLTPAPAEDLVWAIQAGAGFGTNLQGAAGTSDNTPTGSELLHAFSGMLTSAQVAHFTSADGGVTWNPEALAAPGRYDVAASSEGIVYITSQGASYALGYWDTATNSFVLYDTQPLTTSGYFDFLGSNHQSDQVVWVSYDDGTGLLTFEAAKVGALPTVLTSPSAINPVWAGANCSHGSYFMYAALAGGTGVNAAQMFWGPTGDGDMNFLSSPNIDTLDPFELPTTQNKQITAQPFAGNLFSFVTGPTLIDPEFAVWCTYNGLYDAQRTSIHLLGSTTTEAITLPFDWLRRDARRTVASGSGAGLTAVAMFSALDGSNTYMEWSNWGDWEQLPIPAEFRSASLPEIIIGRDGSWHVLYRSWVRDRVYCLNTVN